MIQLFKSYPNKDEFILFIKSHGHKEQNYYKLTQEIYKQIIFITLIQYFF